jgi:CheY-like chemotaxis protein
MRAQTGAGRITTFTCHPEFLDAPVLLPPGVPGAARGVAMKPPPPWRVLVVGADPATFDLLDEWLAEADCHVAADSPHDAGPANGYALVVVDVPYPRHRPCEVLQRVAARHDGTPVLALSATFHCGVDLCGEVARSLGVAGVLAKPIRRDALVSAVRRLCGASP